LTKAKGMRPERAETFLIERIQQSSAQMSELSFGLAKVQFGRALNQPKQRRKPFLQKARDTISTALQLNKTGSSLALNKFDRSLRNYSSLTFFMFNSKILINMLGAKVRVDFVKEAKCPPAFGNLYTWDPESHSLVIARFETKDQEEPSDIIFIPGTSVQNFEVLEDEGEQNNQISTTNNEETKTYMGLRNTEKMKAKIDNLFFPTKIAAGMDNCSEQMNIGELAMNDEEKWENERTISKKIKIFEDFVQGKKKRLIDALNRNGIEFREEGGEEEMTEKVQKGDKNGDENWLTKNAKAKRRKGTIIVGNGVDCVTILPPYEKGNLIGNSTVVKRLVLALAADRVFDDPAQKDHFVGN
uniref:Uncharacterized protein n=1 Tax=Meloidogyne javanica TaxID=6303 RepID=A0A915MDB2_MELJA